jgi:predicted enzyme related to lactoylglutathione lyase
MGKPVVHWELMSKDPAKISAFYETIFGWKIQEVPELKYRMVETGGGVASTEASLSRSGKGPGPAT